MQNIGISFLIYYVVWFGYLCYIQYVEGILISLMIFCATGVLYLHLHHKNDNKEEDGIRVIQPDVYTIV
jgi:hypothetical protein